MAIHCNGVACSIRHAIDHAGTAIAIAVETVATAGKIGRIVMSARCAVDAIHAERRSVAITITRYDLGMAALWFDLFHVDARRVGRQCTPWRIDHAGVWAGYLTHDAEW